MQQTASMRLTIIHYNITVISNVLLFNAVISLDYGLPNDLHKMRFEEIYLQDYCNNLAMPHSV